MRASRGYEGGGRLRYPLETRAWRHRGSDKQARQAGEPRGGSSGEPDLQSSVPVSFRMVTSAAGPRKSRSSRGSISGGHSLHRGPSSAAMIAASDLSAIGGTPGQGQE